MTYNSTFSFIHSLRVYLYLGTRLHKGDNSSLTWYDYLNAHKYFILQILLSGYIFTSINIIAINLMPLIQTALQSGNLESCAYMLLQWALIRPTAVIISNVAGYITEQYRIFLCKQWRESINKQWLQENSMQAKTSDDANLHNELYFTPSLHNIHYIWLVAQHLTKLFIVISSAAQTVPPAMFGIVAAVVMITYFINQAALSQLQDADNKQRRYESVFQTKYKWLFSQLSDIAGLNLGSQVNETCNNLNEELFNQDYEFNKKNRIWKFCSEINKVIEYVFITGFPLYLCYRGICDPALAILMISQCQAIIDISSEIINDVIPFFVYLSGCAINDSAAWLAANDDPYFPQSAESIEETILQCFLLTTLLAVAFFLGSSSYIAKLFASIACYLCTSVLWPNSTFSFMNIGKKHPKSEIIKLERKAHSEPSKKFKPETLITLQGSSINKSAYLPLIEQGEQYFLSAGNGIGKSLFFSGYLAGKLADNIHANCLPQFKSEDSICIQKVLRLLPTAADEYLITRLMQTFSIPCSNENTKELQHYIQAFLDEHNHVFANDKDELTEKLATKFSWHDDTWGSTGQKQLLILLTLLYKIQNSNDTKYICLDEALSGLDAKKAPILYKKIQECAREKQITLVIVHHGYDKRSFSNALHEIKADNSEDSSPRFYIEST